MSDKVRGVDDPRYDATPGVGEHQPVIVQITGDTACVMGVCEHQGPGHCPTFAKKVCAACTVEEVALASSAEVLAAAAMRWPCPVARTGGVR